MPPILDLARRQKSQLAASDKQNLDQVARAYAALYGRLDGRVEALVAAIEGMEPPVTAAQVKRLPQYRALLRDGREELERFLPYLETVIGAAGVTGVTLGLAHSGQLISAMTGSRFPSLTVRAMQPLLNYLRPDGPLYARLRLITDGTIEQVVAKIVEGVGLGKNPRTIARLIQDAFGGGLTDALRNVRTVQLWSYRDSARANYMASGGIVEGWIWYAELDSDTCMSCVAQHGTIHDLDEQLDDHYNGRCAAIPYIPEFGNPVEQSGEEWFSGLSAEEQRAMMGKEKHGAWTEGKFEFPALSRQTANEVWGTMRTEASLASLIGAE
jgi:hypothetical protein